MSLKNIKALLLEDDVYKTMDVRRALQYCGIQEIHCVTNQEDGFKLLKRLKKEKQDIPVIICSSRNIKEPKAFGCVWYSLLRDLNHDFYEVLKPMKG